MEECQPVMNILIVEDDVNIAKYIQTCLSVGNYESRICMNGADAVTLVADQHFDLVLLDVMLPGLDGFAVMGKIKDYGVPVIYLTAVQDVTNKVRGLRSGAEDYIVKPFETLELLARIELVMRRHQKAAAVLAYGNIILDAERHMVKRDGQPVSLTPKEFDVLSFFMEHQDIVITRERLLGTIWGYEFEGETRTVDTHVQQVRKKMGLQGALITVPKYGYKLLKMG